MAEAPINEGRKWLKRRNQLPADIPHRIVQTLEECCECGRKVLVLQTRESAAPGQFIAPEVTCWDCLDDEQKQRACKDWDIELPIQERKEDKR